MAKRTAGRIKAAHAAWVVLLMTASSAAQTATSAPSQANQAVAPLALPSPRPGCEGMVVLQVIIDTRGRVRDPQVVKNTGCADLGKTAIEAAKAIALAPIKIEGTPVTAKATMEIEFRPASAGDHRHLRQAVAIFHPDPPYTEEARKKAREGTVVLSVAVDETGSVAGVVEVSKKLGDGLDKSAIETVKTWKFQPATQDDRAMASQVTVSLSFHLPQTGALAVPATGATTPTSPSSSEPSHSPD